ncbi:MAG: hypothetical protein V1712_02410 [Patescibacteria group bacterium]
MALTSMANAQFQYRDFQSVQGLKIIGNARQVDGKLRLTSNLRMQRGSCWYNIQQLVADTFETRFTFQITNRGGLGGGADGLAFVIQNSSDSVLGANGGGIGYSGIYNSLAIEFDTYKNSGDPNNNHISINSRGILANDANHAYSLGYVTTIPSLANGTVYNVKIRYTTDTIRVYLNDSTLPVLAVRVNLDSLLSLNSDKAWVGFTASTGNGYENHDILSWSFDTVSYVSPPVVFLPGIMGSPLYNGDEEIWVDQWRLVKWGDSFLDVLQLADNGIDPYSPAYHIQTTPFPGGPKCDAALAELPLKKYKKLIDTLEHRGYKLDNWDATSHEGKNLFVFTYDWRKSLKDLADSLSAYLDSVTKWTGANQVRLVAHSYGGLVAKSYAAYYSENNLEQVTFLGTPHLGAPEIAHTQLTGAIVNWQLALAANKGEIKKLAKNFPSCYQLMPSEQYFNLNINNGLSVGLELYRGYISTNLNEVLDYYASKNHWLTASHDGSLEFNSTLIEESEDILAYIWQRPIDTAHIFNIAGYSLPTIGEVTPFPKDFSQIIRMEGTPYQYNLNGDGTVPLRSAECLSETRTQADYYAKKVDHLGLCQDEEALRLVANLLQSPPQTDLASFTKISQERPASYEISCLFFACGSPVQIHIYDELNRHTGPDSDSSWELGIPESYVYAGPLDDPEADKIVILPPGPEYRAVIYSPDSNAYYSLTLSHIENGKKVASLFFDSIATPASAVSRITLSKITSQLKVGIDINHDSLNDYYAYPDWMLAEFYLHEGWNLVSLPLDIGWQTVTSLYHYASSQAFTYDGGYIIADTIPYQLGYWLKSGKIDTLRLLGRLRLVDSIIVNKGWNIISALSVPIPVGVVTSQPENIIISSFYEYDEAYFTADTLKPGAGYWVKIKSAGQLILDATK